LNHTIVYCRDKQRSATFLTEILGLPPAKPFGPFLVVELENRVSLDYYESAAAIHSQHYAFLVGDEVFDQVLSRVRARKLPYWADPAKALADRINTHYNGRGFYFEDPDGHLLEAITHPYGE
jgi:catechol 2,3-dioxygenase-like lactoylglutathione lyase family enzyme